MSPQYWGKGTVFLGQHKGWLPDVGTNCLSSPSLLYRPAQRWRGSFLLGNVLQIVLLLLPSHRGKSLREFCTTRFHLSLWEVISPTIMIIFYFCTLYQAKVGPMGPAGFVIYTTIGKIPLRGRCRPRKASQAEAKHIPSVDFCIDPAHKQSFRISYQQLQSLSLKLSSLWQC